MAKKESNNIIFEEVKTSPIILKEDIKKEHKTRISSMIESLPPNLIVFEEILTAVTAEDSFSLQSASTITDTDFACNNLRIIEEAEVLQTLSKNEKNYLKKQRKKHNKE